jgi:glycosyltransferase involved in cell wall biosynthesis
MEDLIRCLKSHACDVAYLALCPPNGADLSRSSVDTAFFLEAGEFTPVAFDEVAQDGERRAVHKICLKVMPQIVIADYSWMGALFDDVYFKENPSVRKAIFVHDLRVRIVPSYVKMGLMKSEENLWTEEREGKLLARADVLLTLNEEDKRAARSMAPGARTLRMGMSVSPQYVDPSSAVPGRCIYVASGANENLFAVIWLLQHVWPRVLAADRSASLIICGSICDQIKMLINSGQGGLGNLDDLNVGLEGRKDDLRPYYASAQIALVPHWMMGGIKIKHIEAIAHGLAVVCTPAGADGLPEAVGYSALVAEMPAEFANHIIRLMRVGSALEGMRRNSRNLSLKMTPDSVYKEVTDYIRET